MKELDEIYELVKNNKIGRKNNKQQKIFNLRKTRW